MLGVQGVGRALVGALSPRAHEVVHAQIDILRVALHKTADEERRREREGDGEEEDED